VTPYETAAFDAEITGDREHQWERRHSPMQQTEVKTRKFIDCRDHPSEKGCTLKITGSEEEVLRVAVKHAIEDHGHDDTEALKAWISSNLEDE